MIVAQLAPLFVLVRIAAGVGGAIVGYLVAGPVLRLLFRLAFQRPVPGWLLPLGKLGGGALLGVLFFFVVSLGGRGWGLGGGSGAGGAGRGPGPGTGTIASDKAKVVQGAKKPPIRERLEIELLGGDRVSADCYYLVKREAPAKTLGEVEELFKDKADKLEVHVVLTDDSVAASHPAVGRLRELLQRYQIPTVTPAEE
jgi:hypothetical protein